MQRNCLDTSEKRLAVIPARGGSKRIPQKNVKEFCGKPVIAYSIEAALKSELFDEVMVSTDSEEIATIACAYGASVPFMRSDHASDDFATSADVIEEVLANYVEVGREFEILCCIYPTAPFVTAAELRDAAGLLDKPRVSSVVAVTDFDFPPQRGFVESKTGDLVWEHPEFALTRSQDLPSTVHDCGRFYFARTSAWKATRSFVMPGCKGYRIDPALVQDIDTPSDWEIAEMKYQVWQETRKLT